MQLETRYAVTNKDLKEHNKFFKNLDRVIETHSQKSIEINKKATRLEAHLIASPTRRSFAYPLNLWQLEMSMIEYEDLIISMVCKG